MQKIVAKASDILHPFVEPCSSWEDVIILFQKNDFWKKVNFGLLSLRKTNSSSGLRRIDQFKLQFKDDNYNILAKHKQND